VPRHPLVAAGIAVGVTALALLVAFLIVPGLRSESRVVSTPDGELRGTVVDGVRRWLGIPYAQAPVGERRWQPPADVEPWDGERDATEFGAPCLQPEPYSYGQSEPLTALPGSSEDCLTLNVMRPDDDRTGLPVVVWLHGGGFISGTGRTTVVTQTGLLERGAVVVSVNYRLGQLGFFAHPALHGRVANFGLLDQVAALEWVRDSIESFGGDPANVTLAGGSAGAVSVNALMAMPRAEGLFQRAVALSAPSDAPAHSLSMARRRGRAAFPDLDAAGLRALPPTALLSSTFNLLLGDAPIRDDVLPRPAADVFAAGEEDDVPYLVGTTVGEFDDAAFRGLGSDPATLRRTLGGKRHAYLVRAYGESDYKQSVLNDVIFGLPAWRMSRQHDRIAPTYRYLFAGAGRGSLHGSDVPYLFDATTARNAATLAEEMGDVLYAFVTTGHPEGESEWLRASTGQIAVITPDAVQILKDPTARRLRALNRVLGPTG